MTNKRLRTTESDSLCAWNVQETNATLIFVDRLSSCKATKSNNLPQVTCTNNEYQNVANSTLLIEKVTSLTLNVCARCYNPDFVVCSSTNISGKCENFVHFKGDGSKHSQNLTLLNS